MLTELKVSIVLVSFVVFGMLVAASRKMKSNKLDTPKKIKLAFTGFIANLADTMGIGSFAVVTALDKIWHLLDDKKLPGTLNSHGILPAMLQALFFLQIVKMDITTLVTLIIGSSIGGFVGGTVVSRLNKQAVRLAMSLGYLGIAFLIFFRQMNWLPLGGEALSLEGNKLIIAFVAMFVVGTLPAIGVGLYAPTQAILFLLGMSPIVAFPIMTSAGALQQPLTALAFIMRRQFASKETIILSFAGIVGVLVAAPWVTSANPQTLRWLLLAIVLLNSKMLWNSFQGTRRHKK